MSYAVEILAGILHRIFELITEYLSLNLGLDLGKGDGGEVVVVNADVKLVRI